jgi:hypothetical protein
VGGFFILRVSEEVSKTKRAEPNDPALLTESVGDLPHLPPEAALEKLGSRFIDSGLFLQKRKLHIPVCYCFWDLLER